MADKVVMNYGRSTSGKTELVAYFKDQINAAIKAIDGQEYNTLKSTTQKYWVGAACDKFISDLDSKRAAVKKNLKTLASKLDSAFSEDDKKYSEYDETGIYVSYNK